MPVAHATLSRRSSSAFTLIELLVVIAIIGVLIGLLLPAVQAAREAARRSQCTNNLKQLMLAFHSHETAKRGFPPCRTTTTNKQHGWFVDLLPYIEENNTASIYKFDKNFFDAVNQPAVLKNMPMMVCPTMPEDPNNRVFDLGLGATMYGTKGYPGDYAVCHLLNQSLATSAGLACNPCRPVLFVQGGEENKLHPLKKITDGTSHTALVVEQAGRNDYYILRKKQATNTSLTNRNWWGSWGSYQHFTYQPFAADGVASGTVCSVNCNNGQGIYSFHYGGASVGLCDGSVRFLDEATTANLTFSLLTRDGGEALLSDVVVAQ